MIDPVRRRLHAPQEDGAALIDPSLSEISQLVAKNRTLAANRRCVHGGAQSLIELGRAARKGLVEAAMAYTAEYRNIAFVPLLTRDTPILLAGHQPELFHPGVWFKSFLLSALSQRLKAISINLIVDTDTVRSTGIHVPACVESQPAFENVAFDAPTDAVPFEERLIRDRWLFESFDRRALEAYETCCAGGNEPYRPILEALWKAAMAAAARKQDAAKLGLVLAEARHVLESLLGVQTLEIPLSVVAQSREFRRFMLHLLARLPELRHVYNTALSEYRKTNRIRSRTHPVPSLEEEDGWLEAPLLLWTKDDPRRRHLFVQTGPDSLILSDRQGCRVALDVSPDDSADTAIQQLSAAEARGIKIRPRALITTMYARLFLSDLFIHGIGGAKYDELTDMIIRRFFGIEPPKYVTATATFQLPIQRPEVTLEDVRTAVQRIRDVRYRPESFLRDRRVAQDAQLAQQLETLAAEKREFLARHNLRRCPKDVFDQLDRMNRAMHELLRPIEEQLRREHAELAAQWKRSQLLAQREFSFVLFPAEILPARLLDLCQFPS